MLEGWRSASLLTSGTEDAHAPRSVVVLWFETRRQDTDDRDLGSNLNAWICPVSRTTVVLTVFCSALDSTLGW